MREFVVKVEEKVFQDFHVLADSAEDAVRKTVNGYKTGKLVVDNPELISAVAASDSVSEVIY